MPLFRRTSLDNYEPSVIMTEAYLTVANRTIKSEGEGREDGGNPAKEGCQLLESTSGQMEAHCIILSTFGM